MMPIHQLLSRIRWDPRFRQGRFEIGYFDRMARRLIVVPFEDIRFPPGNHFADRTEARGARHGYRACAFEVIDDQGRPHGFPLHRVKAVYRNGKPIWQRPRGPGTRA